MCKFKIENLKVGGNFIHLTINYDYEQGIEFYFYQIPKTTISKTLEIYGVTISEHDLRDYEF